MNNQERRKHRRLALKLEVICRKVEGPVSKTLVGQTANVSTGGLLIESHSGELNEGDLLSVEFSVPDADEIFQKYDDKFSGFAKVLRISAHSGVAGDNVSPRSKYGVAIQFCQPPKFCT